MPKYYPPENMDELSITEYGPNKDGLNVDADRWKRYGNWVETILNKELEKRARLLLADLGPVEKIGRTTHKTGDFVVHGKKK